MRRVLKWTGIVLGSLVGLMLIALGAVYIVSNARMSRTYNIAVLPVAIPSDSASIAYGKRLYAIRGCIDCHGENLGGSVFLDAPPLGYLLASNLTRGEGGVGSTYTDEDWDRAIRHGVRPGGRPLLFMPSHEFYPLSDSDFAALIAYIKSVPPVDQAWPKSTVGPLGRTLYLAGQVPLLPAELIDHTAPRPEAPPAGPTAEYGAYLATGCVGCHGNGYSGGKIPGAPPTMPIPTNVTPHETGIGGWTEADFFRALREGQRPDGTALNEFMPWRLTAQMTDDEIRALWLFLQSLPPRPEGNR